MYDEIVTKLRYDCGCKSSQHGLGDKQKKRRKVCDNRTGKKKKPSAKTNGVAVVMAQTRQARKRKAGGHGHSHPFMPFISSTRSGAPSGVVVEKGRQERRLASQEASQQKSK